MNIAFMASDAVALPSLKMLAENRAHRLSCVISNPDKPKGRGGKISPNEISAWALEKGLELMRPQGRPSGAEIEKMASLGVDCIVVMAYGHILGADILNFPKYGCLNLHASLLPKYRGASPIETALALGDKTTGVSLMRIEPKMDTGAVCAQRLVPISDDDTSASLRAKIASCAAELLCSNLSNIEASKTMFIAQDDSAATYTRKLDKSDMFLDFSKPARELSCRIRAFGGGIFNFGGLAIKAGDAKALPYPFSEPCVAGTVLKSGDTLDIACGDGVLSILSLQKPCAKMLCARDFFNSNKIPAGVVLDSVSNRPLLVQR